MKDQVKPTMHMQTKTATKRKRKAGGKEGRKEGKKKRKKNKRKLCGNNTTTDAEEFEPVITHCAIN